MREKIVYYGDFSDDMSRELYEKSLKYIKQNKEDRFYYILPNGKIINKYRNKYLEDLGGLFQTNLFTFDDIVQNILGNEKVECIEENIKYIHLRILLNRIEDDLVYYKQAINKDGFIKSISSIIREIKMSLIDAEFFIDRLSSEPRDREIGIIYRAYRDYLKEEGLIDREDLYFKAIEKLESGIDTDVKEIILDEFYDFRPIEYKILELLFKEDLDIYINIPYKKQESLDYIDRTLKKLKNIGFEVIDREASKLTGFRALGSSLFQDSEGLELGDDIEVYESVSIDLEIKKIFEIIKGKVKSGTPLNEIAIIYPNEGYLEKISERAYKEKLIISGDIKESILKSTIIKEVLGILKFHINNNKSNLLSRLTGNYFRYPYDNNVIKRIYTFLKCKNINTLEELNIFLDKEKEFTLEEEELKILCDFVDDMELEKKEFESLNEVKDFNIKVKNIFINYRVLERIKSEDSKDEFIYNLKIINSLKRVFKKMEENSKNLGKISLEDYYSILQGFLKEESILRIKNNYMGIQLMDLTSMRGFQFDYIFIAGMVQENYPNISDGNFFINARRYQDLKSWGLEINDYESNFENEMIKISRAVASCNKKLFLSYSLDGAGIRSIFLDEIMRKSSFKKEDIFEINYDYIVKTNIEDVTLKREALQCALDQYNKGEMDYLNYMSYLNEHFSDKYKLLKRKSDMEFDREQKHLTEYNGILRDRKIIEAIRKDQRERKYSSSYLEEYLNCPYSFMLNRLLKIEDIYDGYEEYSYLDIGLIIHETLQEYYETNREEMVEYIFNKGDYKLDGGIEKLRTILVDSFKSMGYEIISPKNRFILENLEERLIAFIGEDLKRMKKLKLLPSEFEKPFVFRLSDGTEITGYIDRIDVNEKGQSVLMDYKSSSSVPLKDILDGKSLQLPIYIMSQKEKSPIGGAYGVLKGASIDTRLELDGSKLTSRKHKGRLDSNQWEELLEQTETLICEIKENILEGNFMLNSDKCPPWCSYRDICRLESK